MKDYWEKDHKGEYEKTLVTSASFNTVANYHKINKPLNKTVLEIGIGNGVSVRNLSSDNKVIACDISQAALDKVKCYKKYLTTELSSIEPVDLAFSHLTLQHCNEKEVARIINDVNLKPEAFFSFQFASLKGNKLTPTVQDYIEDGKLYFYTPEKMEKIVKSTNKKIIYESKAIWFPAPWEFNWYIFRVENK